MVKVEQVGFTWDVLRNLKELYCLPESHDQWGDEIFCRQTSGNLKKKWVA